MNLHTINVIISREYMTRVKKKSFLLITFLGPIFFAAICVLPSLIMFLAEEDQSKIAVIDETHQIVQRLENTSTLEFQDFSEADLDSLKAELGEAGLQAVLHIQTPEACKGRTDTLALGNVSVYSEKPISVDTKAAIKGGIDEIIEEYNIGKSGVENLGTIMKSVKSNVPISTFTLGADGKAEISSSEVSMMISLVLSMIIYMFIAMFSGMVMQSVIEEKSSRVVEVLVSSVKATELMFGKIIGVACVALTQFFLWVALTLVLVVGISSFVGFDSLMASATMQTEQMTQMTAAMGVDADTAAMSVMNMPELPSGNQEMVAVVSALQNFPYLKTILAFVVYFILGYLLYASFFAAIGSAVENEADTQQLQIPVTIPLLIAFFIAFYAFKAPDSAVVFWGSIIPFTSPIVMLARIPFGVPGWEIALSIALLLVTFVLCAWGSAKIYKIGILMFGKKTTFKELWKWLKMK